MFSRTWVINFILAGVILFLWANIWDVWHSDLDIIPASGFAATKAAPVKKKKIPESMLSPDSAYDVVVDSNLFSPDRTSGVEEAAQEQVLDEDVKISGEKVVLYGVIIMGGYKTALINNPDPKSAGRDYRWVKEGDMVGNLRVAGIEKDQILMADGGTNYKVLLYDPDKVKKRGKKARPTAQPKVISLGKKAVSATPGTRQSTGPKVVASEKKAASARSKSPKQHEGKTITEDGKYEIISTPFGKIKRRIR